MKIGMGLPGFGPAGNRETMLTLAREAEKLSFDSLWVGERLLYPVQPKQQPGGAPWPANYQRSLDTLETLVFVAAVTDKIRLGTSTLNLPFHNPAQLAKGIATLDVLSNGRTVIGAGQGWSEDEYDASGVPFSQRTGRTVEMIQALNALWGPDPVEFHGKYYHVPATRFNPKPVQKPRPPLVMASFAQASMARAARLTDGFNPIARPSALETEQTVQALCQAWHDAGREPIQPLIIMRVNHTQVTDQPLGDDRKFLTGSVEQIRGDIRQLAVWGVTEVFFAATQVGSGDAAGIRRQLEDMTKLRQAAD